jgi:ADP-heptose:LPS heptosyltransferase
MALPERFVTVQWDAGGPKRTLPLREREAIMARYPACVVVGGEAEGDLRWSLKHIAYAMSRAEAHVGVDSAFLHLAQLYLPPERIHLYGPSLSLHAKRARVRGCGPA